MKLDMQTILLTITLLIITLMYLITLYKLKSQRKSGLTLEERNRVLMDKVDDNEKLLISKKKELDELIQLEKRELELIQSVKTHHDMKSNLMEECTKLEESIEVYESKLNSHKSDLSIFSPKLELVNLGYFEEPEYLFETSERFKEEIKVIREQQKIMIKEKSAVESPESIAIVENKTHSKKVVKGQVDLMLKAFNLECDKLIGSVKPGNYPQILERIDKTATALEKQSISLLCGFSTEYIKLKFEECKTVYQYKIKKQREQEEQNQIKEQMREEEKARREFERVIAKAEREEKIYKEALDEARKQLDFANDDQKIKLNEKIETLMKRLKEAEESNQRAKSMAEQTRRGHVYIISNIGSFGDNIYKIGLTRRLEPIDRVKELSNASVPFSFDIHAMVYSEDAPQLEKQLHQRFSIAKVNQINSRKEFFNVDLKEIRDAVNEITENDNDFIVTSLAEEYYQSINLRGIHTVVSEDVS